MSIYLDSNATTQVHPRVVDAMLPFLRDQWYNPSSGYGAGREVKRAVEEAREKVAALIGARSTEIVFTGCGTESNNMAIKSLAREIGRKKSRVVVSEIEHSAVLRPTEAMAAVGFDVQRVGVDSECRLRTDELEALVTDDRPGFVSIMWANNETGVVQPIAEVCEIAKRAGWFVHTDAIQAVGKVPVRVDEVPVDFLSISGHKFHAPKGVGALFVRENSPFEPMIRGGGQENGRRSGTENVPYIVGLGEAAEIMQKELSEGGLDRVADLRERLLAGLSGGSNLVGHHPVDFHVNGSSEYTTGNVAHVSFPGCSASDLLPNLDAVGIQCSAGSACMTGKNQPSHVQKAMGFSDERAFSSLRISLSIFSTIADVDQASAAISEIVSNSQK